MSIVTQSAATFDLTAVSRARYEQSRKLRIVALGMFAMMGFFAAIGFVLTIQFFSSGAPPAAIFGGVALLVGGILIASQFGLLFQLARQGSTRLTVDDTSLRFECSPSRADLVVKWDDPHFNLLLYDLRPLGEVNKAGRKRTNMFAALPVPRYYVALTPPAFEAIIRFAQEHRLRIEGPIDVPTSPGPMRRIRIRGI
jgi:hypothetical protein